MKSAKAEFNLAAKFKYNLSRVVNELADRLNEAVEKDNILALAARKEKLEMAKTCLLAKLEQIEKDLYQTRQQLSDLTVEVDAELVTA